ncbi:phage head closure protein [Duganella sp.]|uniref:phage head closure protein n=1 Tax=Duganella sp. TaxID=1904440 RepID=UPI0031D3E758
MRSESLRDRIAIQRRAVGQDEIGQPVEAWEEVTKVWANIRHPSGIEAARAGASTSLVRASIRIRYRADCSAGMRVVHKTMVYDIQAVLPDEVRKDYVDLVCQVAQ